MRLIGVAMVKNEADVVEAFVRHNLRFLDRLLVIDHASGDATLRILHALRDEGLPLDVLRDPAARFAQAERIGVVMRDGLRHHDADYAFALDADEFIVASSRAALEGALGASESPVRAAPWTVYVPPLAAVDSIDPLQRVTLRVDVPEPIHAKAVVGRPFVTRPDWTISAGNHWVMQATAQGDRELRPEPLHGVQLAHLPLRSTEQFLAKVLLGWLGYRLAHAQTAGRDAINWHWRRLFEEFLQGRQFDQADLQRYAMRVYAQPAGTPDEAPLPPLVHDPLPSTYTLRYTETASVDPTRLIAQWATLLLDAVQPAPPRHH